MNRVEQLTFDLLDGVLDAAGLEQLEALIATDPAARAVHLSLCEQEAALRGQLAVDLSRQAMEQLRRQAPFSAASNETPTGASAAVPPWGLGAPVDSSSGDVGRSGTPSDVVGRTETPSHEGGRSDTSSHGPATEKRPLWGPGGSLPVAQRGPSASTPPPAWASGGAPSPLSNQSPPSVAAPPPAPSTPNATGGDQGAVSGRGVGAISGGVPDGTTPIEGAMPAPPAPWHPAGAQPVGGPPAAAPPPPWEPTGPDLGHDPAVPAAAEQPEPQPVLGGAVGAAMVAAESTASTPMPADAAQLRTDDEQHPVTDWSRVTKASLTSMIVHLGLLILLGMWILPEIIETRFPMLLTMLESPPVEEEEREFETVLLDEQLDPAQEYSLESEFSPVPDASLEAGGAERTPSMETIDESHFGPTIALEQWINQLPSDHALLTKLPKGNPGEPRAVVDGYDQALDRITQEILWLLSRKPVMLVWCFDQSESMKDDQDEIHARIDKVYAELGATGATTDDALRTAVTSFGKGVAVHTPQPTGDVEQIRQAIRAVPVDPSGEEMMCRAVGQSIAAYRKVAKLEDRQMAMILVSDESGNREDNDYYLEPTIQQALAAQCRVYVLGREAVFGYPHAHVRWIQPETGREFWLPVDRGPETGFVELLQTDGLTKRTDAHPSGFGPYAQTRLAWATGGIFFMLPSLESDIVRGEKRRYELEVMKDYKPDLRSRAEIQLDIQRSALRRAITRVVYDLNPYREKVEELITPREKFSPDPAKFAAEIQKERNQARFYYDGLRRASELLEDQRPARDREPSMRWKANYDLLRAQLVAYGARANMYVGALNSAADKVRTTPRTLPGDKRLVAWKVRRSREAVKNEAAEEMLRRSQDLYLEVINNHPDTPWAARAEWELKRDFNYPGRTDIPTGVVLADSGYHAIEGLLGDEPGDQPFDAEAGVAGNESARVVAGAADAPGVDVEEEVAVGVGGGGGGGVGVGVDVDAVARAGNAAGWGVEWFPGVELVPEYRAPSPPRKPGNGGGGGRDHGGGRPKPKAPSTPRTPPPKL